MKIISWNVNGYRAVWKKNFTEWFSQSKPDVMCIQETKSWEEQLKPDQINPFGYHSIFSKPERKGYSGVATFSKEKPESHSVGFGNDKFDVEGRVVLSQHAGVYVANIYFPNGKQNDIRLQYKMDFYEETLNYFSSLRKQGKKIVVLGDYNTAHKPIDLSHPKANENISGFLPIEREWIDRWIDAGFVDIFRKFNDKVEQYTWWDQRTRARERNIGWRIDYHFVSDNMVDMVKGAWIEPEVMGSDHCPLGIDVAV